MEAHRVLLSALPPVRWAAAYGSAVFAQPRAGAAKMVDYLLAVDDTRAWHAANLRRNASHYAGAPRVLGGGAAAALAERIGAGVHFNTAVPFAGGVVKYGVVATSRLREDLERWCDLYAAGRLQKPTLALRGGEDGRLCAARWANERAALAAALLLLPRRGASEREMLEAIVGLSYGGDVRMAVGAEAEGKVGAIAEGSREPMREMYAPHLAALQEAGLLSLTADAEAEDACGVERDVSVAAEAALAAQLPPSFKRSFAEGGAGALRDALAATVRASSARAAVAGVCTAGLAKGSAYVMAKLKKGILKP